MTEEEFGWKSCANSLFPPPACPSSPWRDRGRIQQHPPCGSVQRGPAKYTTRKVAPHGSRKERGGEIHKNGMEMIRREHDGHRGLRVLLLNNQFAVHVGMRRADIREDTNLSSCEPPSSPWSDHPGAEALIRGGHGVRDDVSVLPLHRISDMSRYFCRLVGKAADGHFMSLRDRVLINVRQTSHRTGRAERNQTHSSAEYPHRFRYTSGQRHLPELVVAGVSIAPWTSSACFRCPSNIGAVPSRADLSSLFCAFGIRTVLTASITAL